MQIIYSAFLFVLGQIFSRLFFYSQSFALTTGFLWGLLLSVVPSFLSLLFLGVFNPHLFFSLWFVLVTTILLIAVKKGTLFLKKEASITGGVITLFILIAAIFEKFNFSVGSYDSLACYVEPGIQLFSGAWKDFALRFSSVGIFLSLAHGNVSLWGDDYYYLLHPLVFFSLCALFIWSFYQLHPRRENKAAFFTYLSAGMWILSSLFILFNIFYVHTHMISGAYLFLAASCYLYALRKNNTTMLPLFFFSLIAFSLLRLESPFLAVGLVFFSGFYYDNFKDVSLWPLLVFLLPPALWDFRVALMLRGDGDLAGPLLLGGQAIGLALFPCFIFILKKLGLRRSYLEKFTFLILIITIITLGIVQEAKFSVNIFSMFMNLFYYGLWGRFWWGVLVLFFLLFPIIKEKDDTHFCLQYCCFYFLMIVLLGFLRIPYRIGWGDSANRMLISIVPLVLFSLLSSLEQVLQLKNQEKTKFFIRGKDAQL